MTVRRTVIRAELKRVYDELRKRDRKVGYEINRLTQQMLSLKASKPDKWQEQFIVCKQSIFDLRKERRFRDDFKSFSQYYQFIKKEKLSLEDVKSVLNG